MVRQIRVVAMLLLLVLPCACKRKGLVNTTMDTRLDNVMGATERSLRQAQMREFIWNNWRERKSASLHLKSISKEGKETDADYEIRQLPMTLIMVVTINRAGYGHNGQVFWHQDGKYDVYTVERVRPNNPYLLNPNSNVEVLAQSAQLPGADYCLRFKGWGNDVLAFF